MTSATAPRLAIRPLANPLRFRATAARAPRPRDGSTAASDATRRPAYGSDTVRTDPRDAFQQLWQYAYARHQDEASRQDPRRTDAHGDARS